MTGKKYDEISDGEAEIVPFVVHDSANADEGTPPGIASTIRRAVVVGISVVLFFVVLGVIFVLPKFVGQEPPPENALIRGNPDVEITSQTEEVRTELNSARADDAQSRTSSQTLLEQALELAAPLESKNVVQWAADDFSEAKDSIALGEKSYREQRYRVAENFYNTAIRQLESIGSRSAGLVAQAIESGLSQIADGNAEQARKAFTFALSIDPEQFEARRGLARTETLDQVLTLLNEAKEYEELNALDEALQRYREAIKLDAETTEASNSIARLSTIQLDESYRQVMSQGFAAYDAKRDRKAAEFFNHALKLKPDSAEVSEALAQVKNRILANKISEYLSEANKLEASEKWSESAKIYRAAVKLDSQLSGAKASATNADNRSALDQQLSSMIARPDRLSDDHVRREALALLSSAQIISSPGPKLSRQTQQLSLAIEIARTPIPITLVSDELTEVTLYKVGTFGRFAQQSVSVIPGRYVVVGKRVGFRDVRVEFDVSPEQTDRTIFVQCKQKLAFGGSGR
ncbi:MAG: tetratricopeptide (TPR) repeat protein [Gammaproteobacteria bacterium]|jgi:tetratricopeptide (TPR) repeat protein